MKSTAAVKIYNSTMKNDKDNIVFDDLIARILFYYHTKYFINKTKAFVVSFQAKNNMFKFIKYTKCWINAMQASRTTTITR